MLRDERCSLHLRGTRRARRTAGPALGLAGRIPVHDQGQGPKIYLNDLYSLYSQTVKLTGELSHLKLGSDQSDINVWCRYLNGKCASVLQR